MSPQQKEIEQIKLRQDESARFGDAEWSDDEVRRSEQLEECDKKYALAALESELAATKQGAREEVLSAKRVKNQGVNKILDSVGIVELKSARYANKRAELLPTDHSRHRASTTAVDRRTRIDKKTGLDAADVRDARALGEENSKALDRLAELGGITGLKGLLGFKVRVQKRNVVPDSESDEDTPDPPKPSPKKKRKSKQPEVEFDEDAAASAAAPTPPSSSSSSSDTDGPDDLSAHGKKLKAQKRQEKAKAAQAALRNEDGSKKSTPSTKAAAVESSDTESESDAPPELTRKQTVAAAKKEAARVAAATALKTPQPKKKKQTVSTNEATFAQHIAEDRIVRVAAPPHDKSGYSDWTYRKQILLTKDQAKSIQKEVAGAVARLKITRTTVPILTQVQFKQLLLSATRLELVGTGQIQGSDFDIEALLEDDANDEDPDRRGPPADYRLNKKAFE